MSGALHADRRPEGQAADLIEGLPAEVVMADAAYDADHLRQAIAAKRALAVIPNNPSRALKHLLDKHLFAQRHLVECCFSKLKQFRRVATRFEKSRAKLPGHGHARQQALVKRRQQGLSIYSRCGS